MKETPVNKIMENTLEKMREMVDVSTIIGDPMVTGDTTLIPVSKVTYGFTSGGTDLPTKQQNQELFGGGGGGGRLPGQGGQPHHPHPPGGGGRGAAGLPAGGSPVQGGPLSASPVRRPV